LALQETHNDLLSLLAQEELELQVFRDALKSHAGDQVFMETASMAQSTALEKYGSYIDLHGDESLLMDQAVIPDKEE
jgi:hypothetical protein